MTPSLDSEAALTPTMFEQSPTVEEYVREYFDDTPVLAEVARCESRFRHFNKYGDILRGEANSFDVGVMQINEHYHLETANSLGYDLYSLDGNLGYAQYLFEKQGTQPWKASSKCWGLENHVAVK